jgi:hypothetical protein
MEESDRYEMSEVQKVFFQATELWEKLVSFLRTFICSNVTTDGRVVCFTVGSTKITVPTPYLLPIPRFGTCMVIFLSMYVHDEQRITNAAVSRPLLHEGDEIRQQIHLSDRSPSFNHLVGYGRGFHCPFG